MPDIYLRQGAANPSDAILRGPPDITGTCTQIQQLQFQVDFGALIFAGAGAQTQQPQIQAGTGALIFAGISAQVQVAQTEAGIGALIFAGVGIETQQAQTESGVGALIFVGSSNQQQEPQSQISLGNITGGQQEQPPPQEWYSPPAWKVVPKKRKKIAVVGWAASMQIPQAQSGGGNVVPLILGFAEGMQVAVRTRAIGRISYDKRNERELVDLIMSKVA